MGCFCRRAVLALQDKTDHGAPAATAPSTPSTALVAAASDWLAARWLPAPAWQPDPDWLDAVVPDPPMPPAALSVLAALVQARQACTAALGADPAEAADGPKLARIVRTLNQRLPALQALSADPRPWAPLAALAAQADTVHAAAAQGVFQPAAAPEPPTAPWRPLLGRLKAVAPLLAVAQLLGVDPARGDLPEILAGLVRKLRAISVPPLADPGLVMRLIAQGDAAGRLQRSLGADPRGAPFARVQDAVLRKVDAAAALLPQTLNADGGRLSGAPARQPNPGALINADVIKLAQALPAAALARMQWQVPGFDQFPLLTTLAPVASLAAALGGTMVRSAPCGPDCDAGTL